MHIRHSGRRSARARLWIYQNTTKPPSSMTNRPVSNLSTPTKRFCSFPLKMSNTSQRPSRMTMRCRRVGPTTAPNAGLPTRVPRQRAASQGASLFFWYPRVRSFPESLPERRSSGCPVRRRAVRRPLEPQRHNCSPVSISLGRSIRWRWLFPHLLRCDRTGFHLKNRLHRAGRRPQARHHFKVRSSSPPNRLGRTCL